MPIRSEHLDEKTLELHTLRSPLVNDRQAEIKNHLKHCPWCNALAVDIETYYREVEEIRRPLSASPARALYPVERMIRLRTEGAPVPIPSGGNTTLQRVFETMRRHPVRWTAGFAAVLSLATFGVEKALVRDLTVAYALPDKEFLVAYNKNSEELWRNYLGYGFDIANAPHYISKEKEFGSPVLDVDGDGTNEVINISGWKGWDRQERKYDNDVFCLNADGSERWKFELHRNVTIGTTQYSDDYRFYQIIAGDFRKSGRAEVFGLAVHIPWFPSVIVRLDARDGTLLGEYWHNGMLPYVARKDIDHDGVEELFFAGQNNRFGAASLLVLDPRYIEGYAPAPEDFRPQGMKPGLEKYYLLFPPSDLRPFWADITHEVQRIAWRQDGRLEVWVVEKIISPDAQTTKNLIHEPQLLYYFDSAMRCVDVRVSDAFSALHARFKSLGKVKNEINNAYLEQLRQGVRYWNGGQFVKEPIMNARYRGLANK